MCTTRSRPPRQGYLEAPTQGKSNVSQSASCFLFFGEEGALESKPWTHTTYTRLWLSYISISLVFLSFSENAQRQKKYFCPTLILNNGKQLVFQGKEQQSYFFLGDKLEGMRAMKTKCKHVHTKKTASSASWVTVSIDASLRLAQATHRARKGTNNQKCAFLRARTLRHKPGQVRKTSITILRFGVLGIQSRDSHMQ